MNGGGRHLARAAVDEEDAVPQVGGAGGAQEDLEVCRVDLLEGEVDLDCPDDGAVGDSARGAGERVLKARRTGQLELLVQAAHARPANSRRAVVQVAHGLGHVGDGGSRPRPSPRVEEDMQPCAQRGWDDELVGGREGEGLAV